MKTVEVRVRVEPELKRDAAAVLKASGLDVSTAIRLFLRSVVETGGLPTGLHSPNVKTLAAIKAAKASKATKVSLDKLGSILKKDHTMPKTTDAYEAEILAAYDKGELKSVATQDELAKFSAQRQPAERDLYRKAAARLADTSRSVKVNLDQL